METGFKTQLLIGGLGAAVLCAGAYGLYRESRRTSQGPAGQVPREAGPVGGSVAGSGRAALRIETLSAVTGGTTGHEARVFGQPGLTFEWSIQGGKLDSWNQRDSVLWTAGPSGEVLLTCRAFDGAGGESKAVARIQAQPAPTISRFEAAPPVLALGSSAKLGWAAKDCRKLVLDPGGQDVTAYAGPGFEVKPTDTTTYRLTATNALGTEVTRELTLQVAAPPQIGSLRAEPGGVPEAFTVVGEFQGGKAELKREGTVLATAATSPLRAELSGLKPGASLSLVVTNEAGATVTATLQFTVQKP